MFKQRFYTFKMLTKLRKRSGQHKCNYRRGCKLPKDFSGFKSVHDLKRHKRTVHGEACEESYMCAVTGCKKPNKSWPRCDNFKAHVKRMHPREDVDEIIQRCVYWSCHYLDLSDISSLLVRGIPTPPPVTNWRMNFPIKTICWWPQTALFTTKCKTLFFFWINHLSLSI